MHKLDVALDEYVYDDLVFQLCELFLERPDFCADLDQLASKARGIIDEISEWNLSHGRREVDAYHRNTPGMR